MLDKPKRLRGLDQKVRSQVGVCYQPPREPRTLPVYRANLNHPVSVAEHGKAANPVRLATGQTSPQGGSGGAALGRPKKPTPAVTRWIRPRRSSLKWQESRRNRNSKSGKQMTTGACRSMRPEAGAQGGTSLYGHTPVLPSGWTVFPSARGSATIVAVLAL